MLRSIMPMLSIAALLCAPPALADAPSAGAPSAGAPRVGAPAPVFSGIDFEGNPVSLADFAGRTVVLEWTNHECPFVQKHYDTGNMQATQDTAAASHRAVWLSIVSSAPGKQGHVEADRARQIVDSQGARIETQLLDPEGTIGRLYDAQTTPQMAIIDADGVLRYYGAIDDKPSARHSTVENARNYVLAALNAMAAGEDPDPAVTRPYGCSVKY